MYSSEASLDGLCQTALAVRTVHIASQLMSGPTMALEGDMSTSLGTRKLP